MKHMTWVVVAMMGLSAAAAAQTPPASAAGERAFNEQQAKTVQMRQHLESTKSLQHAEQQIITEQMRVTVPGKTVKGAPYAADAITESVQVLADGNRIVKKSATRVYRDSEGRTRTEEVTAEGVRSVRISDPVSGETWTLDPQARTALRSGVFVVREGATGGVAGGVTVVTRGTAPASVGLPHATVVGGVAGGVVTMEHEKGAVEIAKGTDVTREDLGRQTFDGLVAAGTRTTTTVPAGAIGNEQPIKIVSEQWFSSDLQVLVLTRFSDPRVGETTYRLTNVSRAEPDRSLFTVPSDYTVKGATIKREPR